MDHSLLPLASPSAALPIAAGAALLAGLTSSLHCFAMCGPLACAGCAKAQPSQRVSVAGAYQVARVGAYTLVGGALGLLGAGALAAIGGSSALALPWLPWVMAGLLIASALGLGERTPNLPGLSQALRAANRAGARFSPRMRAAMMGGLTPLLPCGLLYGLYASTLLTGSFGRGALVAGSFALGGVPALVLAQAQTSWLHRLPKGAEFVLRRVVPVAAAAALIFRALATHGADAGASCH